MCYTKIHLHCNNGWLIPRAWEATTQISQTKAYLSMQVRALSAQASVVPRLRPAFQCWMLKTLKSWVEPGDEATSSHLKCRAHEKFRKSIFHNTPMQSPGEFHPVPAQELTAYKTCKKQPLKYPALRTRACTTIYTMYMFVSSIPQGDKATSRIRTCNYFDCNDWWPITYSYM